MSALKVEWVDGHREPQCPPRPEFPAGIDLDASFGAAVVCSTDLPYPAKRCGHYVVTCSICGQTIAITTAGRADDPRSLKIACQLSGNKAH